MDNRWQQALFDLMANEKVKVVVEGEVGEVDAVLYLWERREWRQIAVVIAAETFEHAMRDLMEAAQAA